MAGTKLTSYLTESKAADRPGDAEYREAVRQVVADRAGARCPLCHRGFVGASFREIVLADGRAAHSRCAADGPPQYPDAAAGEAIRHRRPSAGWCPDCRYRLDAPGHKAVCGESGEPQP